MNKQEQSRIIEKLTADFLAAGNTVTAVPADQFAAREDGTKRTAAECRGRYRKMITNDREMCELKKSKKGECA